MKLETLRTGFLSYFAENGHNIVRSAPLVPHNDPTLMFTNAGMVPFKNIFTGKEAAPMPPRNVSAQKCVRAGGKHNDLDNVGYTARHHTFFEMMGNFSFGDYFKEQAILHAWTLLTRDFGLPKEKLFATVYHTDDEAFALWRKIAGLPEEKILRIPTSDNFWAMGDTGPCGPCSEIFYDHGADAAEGSWSLNAAGEDQFGDRFIEIWNLVFMQYEQVDIDTRIALPKPSIDTGMGLERMAAVMQGVHNNYHVDIFRDIIAATESIIGASYRDDANVPSYHVIADHLRSSCFLIADGVLPSNEGRGYVLRRIMRRAMRHAHMLGAKKPVMFRLVDTLISLMGGAYPELHRAEALIKATLEQEELRFRETLGRGLRLLEEEKAGLGKGDKLAGEVAFKLYDTYGFPLDLTQDILRGQGIAVDVVGFEAAMDEQKARARAAWKGSGDTATDALWFSLYETHGATEFLGYAQDKASAIVKALVKDGKEVSEAKAGDVVQMIVNQTPCYGESGGQMGDRGQIATDKHGVVGVITDTTIPVSGLFVHQVTVEKASLKLGDVVDISIDVERRNRIRANHSATHLLHAVLRKVLGGHVTQKGSLVAPEKLRFDFSHQGALSPEELGQIEQEVNRLVWKNSPVTTRIMKPDDAINAGAMALFGEKYGEEVRVLSMGAALEEAEHYSVELCGGTHVTHTGDIGMFVILSESAIAAGVRRIEAATLQDAFTYLSHQRRALQMAASMLTATAEDVPARVETLLEERKASQKELAELKKQLALAGSGGAAEEQNIGDMVYLSRHVEGLSAKDLRPLALEMLKGRERCIAAVTTNEEGKGSVIVALTPDLTTRLNAAELVKAAVEVLGGKGGGGKPELAQGGGADGSKGKEALQAIAALL